MARPDEKNDDSEEAADGKTVTEIRSMFEKKNSKENPYSKGDWNRTIY